METDRWRQLVRYRNGAQMLQSIAEETPRRDHSESLRRVARYWETTAATLERELRCVAAPA